MQKVILYYKFFPITDPEAVRLWQKTLADKLSLKGRIIISEHGINGTLGGEVEDLKTYVKETKTYKSFKGMDFKWSDGARDDFPKLSVKVRDEIVTFGAKDELIVNEDGVVGCGKHLTPNEVHELVKERGNNVVFFDGRNRHESAVGKFKNAVFPPIRTSREFINELNKAKYNKLKDRPVVTYCTGGIRCEVISMLMKNRGFKEVYQLDGGIVKYGEQYGDSALWEGSLYIFDGRMGVKFSDQAKDIGKCIYCQKNTSRYINCANKACNELILVCEDCNIETYCKDDTLKNLEQVR